MSWKDNILDAFEVFGPASLFVLSFTEAIVQPIPPDVMYIPMLANAAGDVPLVVWLWFTVTVASVLGSLVGYWIGQRWGTSLMKRFGQEKHLTKLEHLTGHLRDLWYLHRRLFSHPVQSPGLDGRHGPHGQAVVRHGGIGRTGLALWP